jgi:quercetin dioxygenase-like cupin family protein
MTTHTKAGSGPHHLLLGTVAVSRLLGAEETGGDLGLLELEGLPGSGPGAHVDPWRESFYVLEGELTFRLEGEELVAGRGDAVSIPSGLVHAFSVSSPEPARYLILCAPAGLEAFFADAGEPLEHAGVPADPPPFDRARLLAAFERHGLTPATLD